MCALLVDGLPVIARSKATSNPDCIHFGLDCLPGFRRGRNDGEGDEQDCNG
jgi:hypothetical protein